VGLLAAGHRGRPPLRRHARRQRPLPGVAGALGEAGRGRVGLLDGVYGGLGEAERDIFADPTDTTRRPTRLRLVLLRDGGLEATDEAATASRPRRGARGPRRCSSSPSARACGSAC
jgi:hypothetical protein